MSPLCAHVDPWTWQLQEELKSTSQYRGRNLTKRSSGIAAHSRFTGHSFSFARVLSSDSYYSNVVKKEALFILGNRDSKSLCNARGTIGSLFVSGPWYSLLHCFSLE